MGYLYCYKKMVCGEQNKGTWRLASMDCRGLPRFARNDIPPNPSLRATTGRAASQAQREIHLPGLGKGMDCHAALATTEQ
jgi:hypothetical protein